MWEGVRSLWGVRIYGVIMGCGEIWGRYGVWGDTGCHEVQDIMGPVWGVGLWGHGDPGCGYGAMGIPAVVMGPFWTPAVVMGPLVPPSPSLSAWKTKWRLCVTTSNFCSPMAATWEMEEMRMKRLEKTSYGDNRGQWGTWGG